MIKSLIIVGVVPIVFALSGCKDDDASQGKESKVAPAQISAHEKGAEPKPSETGEPAKTVRVGHRMQLEPISADKFKLGPQPAKPKADGSK